jgi:hypothetical protein
MGVVPAVILITVLTICSIGPGLFLLPWLHVDDDETFVVVVAMSWLAMFLAAAACLCIDFLHAKIASGMLSFSCRVSTAIRKR